MNKILQDAFEKTVSLFENDSRVLAAYHSGSVGTDKDEETIILWLWSGI